MCENQTLDVSGDVEGVEHPLISAVRAMDRRQILYQTCQILANKLINAQSEREIPNLARQLDKQTSEYLELDDPEAVEMDAVDSMRADILAMRSRFREGTN